MKTCYKRCRYCAKVMSRWQASHRRGMEDKMSTCQECKGARGEARRVAAIFFPNRELTKDLIRKVRRQFEINEAAENRKWSPHQKLAREILREKKELCRAENVGRKVERRPNGRGTWSRATEMFIVDVRIRDGQVEYGLAFGPEKDVRYWEPRSACEGAFSGAFGSGSWRFPEPEAVHA